MTYLSRTALIGLFLLAAPVTLAGSSGQDQARRALLTGEIVPLSQILAAAAKIEDGDVLEVELEREDGRWVYEVEMLCDDGELLELKFDARSAAFLSRDRHDDEPGYGIAGEE